MSITTLPTNGYCPWHRLHRLPCPICPKERAILAETLQNLENLIELAKRDSDAKSPEEQEAITARIKTHYDRLVAKIETPEDGQ